MSSPRELSRFAPPRLREAVSLGALADRLTQARFHFERTGGLLTVRGKRGRVEFQRGEDSNDFRADVYGNARILVVNLVTVLQVYGLTAHFHFVDKMKWVERVNYGGRQ